VGLSINLRFDLKKLSDAQLAERLECFLQTLDAAQQDVAVDKLRWSARGFLRHSSLYPFTSILLFTGPIYAVFGLAVDPSLWSLMPGGRRFRELMHVHLTVCEVRDIMDELQRRGHHAATGAR
jgi:hypothetical protein